MFCYFIFIKKQIESNQVPNDLDQIDVELLKQRQLLNEVNAFQDRINDAKNYVVSFKFK